MRLQNFSNDVSDQALALIVIFCSFFFVFGTVRSCLSVVCVILMEYGTSSQAQALFSN